MVGTLPKGACQPFFAQKMGEISLKVTKCSFQKVTKSVYIITIILNSFVQCVYDYCFTVQKIQQ